MTPMSIAILVAQNLVSDQLVPILMVVAAVVILSGFALMIATRYKRCPSNRILVIYGKTGAGQSSRPLHGGGTFVWPLIQSYDFLELEPLQIEIPLEGALSSENIRVSVPSVFTVAIGTDEETMNNAAVRLLGLDTPQIIKQAEDIIFGTEQHEWNEQVMAAIESVLDDVRKNGITAAELARAKAQLRARLVFDSDSVTNIAHQLGYFETVASAEIFTGIGPRIAEVTVERVAERARELFNPSNRTIGWFEFET